MPVENELEKATADVERNIKMKLLERDTTQTDTVTFGNKIFGIDEWNNRENQANAALHKAPKKPETVTPPVTFDDIQTINVKKESEENG